MKRKETLNQISTGDWIKMYVIVHSGIPEACCRNLKSLAKHLKRDYDTDYPTVKIAMEYGHPKLEVYDVNVIEW